MKLIQYCLVFGMMLVTLHSFSQDDILIDPVLVRVQARIISAADSSGVPYANIVNHRTHSGTITGANGYFTLEMLNVDTLVVSSVGYQKLVIKIPYNYNGQDVLLFTMMPVNYALGEVRVEGDKQRVDLGFETGKPVDIDPQLRGDAFNESPPVLAALFNPISYWQYYLSRREKQKRRVREEMQITRYWEMHSKNYNKQMVMMLTGLDETAADTFMVWFNTQNVLPYTSSEYQVRSSIIDYYRLYQLEQQMK